MSRPFLHLNVAATVDGKIDTFQRRGATLSSVRDKERVDQLRADFDAILVGGRTLHDEDPRMTVKSKALRAQREKRGLPPNPAKVAVASRLELQPGCRFLVEGPSAILLFTTSKTAADQLTMLRSAGAQVFVLPGEQPDLVEVLRLLHEHGIQRLLVEGGATLNFALLKLGLVDELTVYIAPQIVGGESAPTLAGGFGLPAEQAIRLKLLETESWDDGGILLHYAVNRES